MSETTTPSLPPRRIELSKIPPPDQVAASPHQLARLRYLGVAVEEPLSNQDANVLIEQTNNDPAFAALIESWESEKRALHPDLFRVPPRFAGLSVPTAPLATSSPYAPISSPAEPAFVPAANPLLIEPARSSPAKPFLWTVVAILAVLGAAGWYLRKSPWLLQTLHRSPIAGISWLSGSGSTSGSTSSPTSGSTTISTTISTSGSTSGSGAPNPAIPQGLPTPGVLPPDEFAHRVAESQRLAVARYPALGTTTSEINMRFVYRYKLLLSEHSPRLQEPDWPLQLADECAAAAKVKPAGSTAGTPGASGRSQGKPSGH